MPRASTEASDKFSAKYGQSVGVVIFDDVFVPHDRASRRVELPYDTATESTIGGLLTNQIFHRAGEIVKVTPLGRAGSTTSRDRLFSLRPKHHAMSAVRH